MDSKKVKYSFDHNDAAWGQHFSDACEEIDDMRLWNTEELDFKDHKNTDGCLVYCGNSYIHRSELLYGEGAERLIPLNG